MRLMQRLEILVGKREDIQGAYNALTSHPESSWCINLPFFGVKMKLEPQCKTSRLRDTITQSWVRSSLGINCQGVGLL